MIKYCISFLLYHLRVDFSGHLLPVGFISPQSYALWVCNVNTSPRWICPPGTHGARWIYKMHKHRRMGQICDARLNSRGYLRHPLTSHFVSLLLSSVRYAFNAIVARTSPYTTIWNLHGLQFGRVEEPFSISPAAGSNTVVLKQNVRY